MHTCIISSVTVLLYVYCLYTHNKLNIIMYIIVCVYSLGVVQYVYCHIYTAMLKMHVAGMITMFALSFRYRV